MTEKISLGLVVLAGLPLVGPVACGDDPTASDCGPAHATVASVIDGDTIDLTSGDRVRYLLADAPELGEDCYASEARTYNTDLVDGRQVTLSYDQECTDRYGRLLAYVEVQGRDVTALLIERGYACLLVIPPNGVDRTDEPQELQDQAEVEERGMWGACREVACAE